MPDAVATDVADRLFTAIERSDIATVAQLFSPVVAVWKSGDTRDNDHARSVKIITWFVDATLDRRYEVLDRQMFDGGFVQQHVLHARGRTGATIAMRVCIVIKVGPDGLITRIDEYFDPAEIAPLLSQTSS
ncbi:nuclear transport factor 2 family protein [Mycobacterium sp. ITM-2016-00317]|uniref:nuclear transport factor 2 family protein n=1 Tax=Mycobacterium sp. ITM-2016-00317 TaxID=2099694 RepID=UPI000D48D6B5|nr:nuclear transport factor 2 family protein [Mycobacterium sp. ITM-2016-00317]WNG89198.1 nuclear transport factor 2 family protein [Mycobacterium sp. ITM-2016-00317]